MLLVRQFDARYVHAVITLILVFPVLQYSRMAQAQVKPMVDKAMKYLETASHSEVGGKCLIGMAFLKTGADHSHPKVQDAAKHATEFARQAGQGGLGQACYNGPIVLIFLCEADPERYAREIGSLHNALVRRQQANGGWGYNPHTHDDTSQTQYGMLALWSAHNAGVRAPVASVERAMHWLVKMQSKTGGFPYSPNGTVTRSMSAAGVGSLYIGAHLLGLGAQVEEKKKGPSLPPALQRVIPDEEKRKQFQTLRPQTVNAGLVRRATSAGNAWFDKNFAPENNATQWTYYYLYGLERYKSFEEIVEGKQASNPAWYNAGVEYLRNKQAENGSWSAYNAAVDTAFAVLFLVRSTKKSIGKAVMNEGVLVGGHGLPKDIANATMQDGKVVKPQSIRDVDDLLKMVEGADNKEFDANALDGLSLDADLEKRTNQLVRLRELVSNEDYSARRAAVKMLASARELDNVPALIYALTDQDQDVARYARDGLRFISRKFQGFGLSERPTADQKQAAAEKWKTWYLSIRPDGELLE